MRGQNTTELSSADITTLVIGTAALVICALIGWNLYLLDQRYHLLARITGKRKPAPTTTGSLTTLATELTAELARRNPGSIPGNKNTSISLRRTITAHIAYSSRVMATSTIYADFFTGNPYAIRFACEQGLTPDGLLMLDISRDLIREAITTYTRVGDGHTKICVTVADRRPHFDIDYDGPLGHVALLIPAAELRDVLDATDKIVAPGKEQMNLDAELTALLGDHR